jgi:DNA polymerase I-like protein with 3'-5' exonuclease and polymerase domains
MLFFDLEADGLLDEATRVWCMVTVDSQGRVTEYVGDGVKAGIDQLLLEVKQGGSLVAHNGIGYDYPLIKKLYGVDLTGHEGECLDSLVVSRLAYPDLKELDFARLNKFPNFPKQLIGSHSLRAWGERLGHSKGDYDDFSQFTPEMLEYCVNDTVLLRQLWTHLRKRSPSIEAEWLEHRFAEIMLMQEQHGFMFDKRAAENLHIELLKKQYELEEKAKAAFPPQIVQLKTKTKTIPFNPGSRKQIAEGFISKYGWEPREFTPDGKPRIDEAVLRGMSYPEASVLLEYLLVQKRISQLAVGSQAWLRHVKEDGRMHGRVNPIGCVTGRCSHSKPNVAQVPAAYSPYGKECRSLFTVPEGFKLVGADASGLELRCLAHYLHRYDGGKYVKQLLEGDIHTENAKAAGLDVFEDGRSRAKTMIYCFLYGGGPEKLGAVVGGGREDGVKLRNRFLKKTPALKQLRDAVQAKVKKQGFLLGIDGRVLPIRHSHAALNTLLQSAGAIMVKLATVLLHDMCKQQGLKFGVDYANVAHIHDELQLEVVDEKAELVGNLAVHAIREAGKRLDCLCPLDAEYRVGTTWAETH